MSLLIYSTMRRKNLVIHIATEKYIVKNCFLSDLFSSTLCAQKYEFVFALKSPFLSDINRPNQFFTFSYVDHFYAKTWACISNGLYNK